MFSFASCIRVFVVQKCKNANNTDWSRSSNSFSSVETRLIFFPWSRSKTLKLWWTILSKVFQFLSLHQIQDSPKVPKTANYTDVSRHSNSFFQKQQVRLLAIRSQLSAFKLEKPFQWKTVDFFPSNRIMVIPRFHKMLKKIDWSQQPNSNFSKTTVSISSIETSIKNLTFVEHDPEKMVRKTFFWSLALKTW